MEEEEKAMFVRARQEARRKSDQVKREFTGETDKN